MCSTTDKWDRQLCKKCRCATIWMTGQRKRREYEQRCRPKGGTTTVAVPPSKINVNIIRAFEGPLHSRLEKIWGRIAAKYKDVMNLYVFDNIGAKRRHAQCLAKMVEEEFKRPELVTIFTEFDFLPEDGFFDTSDADVAAVEYGTRNPPGGQNNPLAPGPQADGSSGQFTTIPVFTGHGIPGAWFVRIWKPCIFRGLNGFRAIPESRDRLNMLRDGLAGERGKFRDPANELFESLQRAPAIQRRLLESEDCYPDTYGVRTPERGVHLFWSRHYNDQPTSTVAGFGLAPILRGVKRYIARYEKALDRCDGALPPARLLAPGNS